MYNEHTRFRRINIRMLLRVVGWLLMIESAFMLVPLATALIYGEHSDAIVFGCTAGFTALTGTLLTFCIKAGHSVMGKREGFLLTASTWLVMSLFGMLPFMFGTPGLNVSSAFFEAMSGFTTTGASVMHTVSTMGHGIMIWRCLMQWIGGMGIILFTLAVLPMLNHSGGMQMFNAEVTGITHEKIRPRISQTAKSLWGVYLILTVVLAVLLWLGPMNLYESVCHAFATIATGGFSTNDNGIEGWDSVYVDVVITVFMFLSGTSFSLLYKAGRGEPGALWRNDVFRVYVKAIAVIYVLFVISILTHDGLSGGWRSLTINPLFQIISTMSSTGYAVCNFEQWGSLVLSLLFLMMFFGACAGSTSGGAKLDRGICLIQFCRNEINRTLYPNTIMRVRLGGRVVGIDGVNKVVAFICIYVLVIMVGAMIVTGMGVPLLDSFFSAFSCVSNTGLGGGVTGYAGVHYSVIPDAGKWVLALLMLIGRLELFTVLLLFAPAFWRN